MTTIGPDACMMLSIDIDDPEIALIAHDIERQNR